MTIEPDLSIDMFSTVIKVFGVGGAGGNAINTMIENGVVGPEYIVVNTDISDLKKSKAKIKIQIGQKLTGGKGAGAKPEVGKDAALESEEELSKALDGADMVFIAAGFGGGTGTGAAPVIARLAREKGILSLGFITKPSKLEGKLRDKNFEDGFNEISQYIDSYLIIPNEKLSDISEKMSVFQVYKKADQIISDAAKAMFDIINKSGYINVDFADVKTVLANKGCSVMGTAIFEGENRAINAAKAALSNPLLNGVSLNGCEAVLINVTGGDDLEYEEFESIIEIVNNETGGAETTIPGLVNDNEMNGKIFVTVFASGLPSDFNRKKVIGHSTIDENVSPELKNIFSKIRQPDSNEIDNEATLKKNGSSGRTNKQNSDIPSFMREFSN